MRYSPTRHVCFLFYFSALALLSSCSKPPAAPELSRRDAHPVEKVLFPQGVGPQEIRRLFGALNRDGRLDRLKPFFFDPSDATLSRVGRVVTRFLYDRALETEGFPAVLDRHIGAKNFSELAEWSQGTGAFLLPVLNLGLTDRRLRDLVVQDYGFISPKWTALLPSSEARPVLTDDEAKSWAQDAKTFFADAPLKASSRAAFMAFYPETGGPTLASQLLSFMATLTAKQKTDLSQSVARLSGNANRPLSGIAPLFESLRQHPSGILPFAIQKLEQEADLRSEFAALLFNHVYDSIGSTLFRNLKSTELNSRESRFIVVRRSIEEIVGRSKPADAPDYLLANLPIYLPTIVTSLWLEKLADSPENKTILDRLKAAKTGADVDLDIPIVAPAISLPIFTKKPNEATNEVNPVFVKELEALQLTEFHEALKPLANTPGLGNFHYDIAFPEPRLSFPEALNQLLRQCEQVRSFGDPALLARVFLHKLTGSPEYRKKFVELDKNDWLAWLHTRVIDHELWPVVKDLLFSEQGILSENGDTKRLLLSLFEEKPEYHAYLEKLFGQLKSLEVLDSAPAKQGSFLSFYIALNETLSQADKRGLVTLAESLSRLIEQSHGKLQGPLKELTFLAKNPQRLNDALTWIGETARANRTELLRPFAPWQANPAHTFDTHWDLTAAIVAGTEALPLARSIQAGLTLVPNRAAITPAEYAWLSRFVADGGWEQLFDFLYETTTRASWIEFLDTVQELERSGYLAEVLELLQRLKDERARTLAASLQSLQKTGELGQALRFLQALVK